MQQPTRIVLIRHGETDWNTETRIQGHTDIPLNRRGRWQAQRLGAALADEGLAAVYASDLQRAHATAQAVAQASGLEVVVHSGLRERAFGVFEGLTFSEIEDRWTEWAAAGANATPSLVRQVGRRSKTFSSAASRRFTTWPSAMRDRPSRWWRMGVCWTVCTAQPPGRP